jgi:hypothetical protein
MKGKIFGLLMVFAMAYVFSYAWLRKTHTQVWDRDGRAYVIFPSDGAILYYLFRPLSYIDGAVTGMGFHIGPHQ